MFTNINSLSADNGQRFEDLAQRLKTGNIHIAAICEDGDHINISDWNIVGYHNLNDSLYSRKGRGMVVYIHDTIGFKRCPDLEDNQMESMFFDVFVGHRKILIGSVYRSPSQTPAVRTEFMFYLDQTLTRLGLSDDKIYMS
jgi:hypothetical protein